MSERNFTPPAGTPDYLTRESKAAHVGEAHALLENIIQLMEQQPAYTVTSLKADLREVLRLLEL